MAQQTTWPALDSGACRDTLTTLHLCAQIVGKVQLALTPSMAGWAQAPLRLTPRGLTTQLLWTGDRSMTIQFDLTGHELRFDLSDGARRTLPLEPRPVAEFYAAVTATLAELGVEVTIEPDERSRCPSPCRARPTRSTRATTARASPSLFQVWTRVGAVVRSVPLGVSRQADARRPLVGHLRSVGGRYSGRPASPPFDRDAIERVAMDAEQSLVGFWPGDELSPEPAFFSYTYPKPAGIEAAVVTPEGALWSPEAGEFIVPYEVIRGADDPATCAARLLRVDLRGRRPAGRLGPRSARAPAVGAARRLTIPAGHDRTRAA